MLYDVLCKRGCRQKADILKLLSEGPKTTGELSLKLRKEPPIRYNQIYRYLHMLEGRNLIFKKGKRWHIEPEVQRHLPTIYDPTRLRAYIAGSPDIVSQVLSSLGWKVPYLSSAGRYWRSSKFNVNLNFDFASEVFVDSGAQQFYKRFRGFHYPYTSKAYLDFAIRIGADYIATLDLPLDILTPRGLNVMKGLRKTVEYGVENYAVAERSGVREKIVPVLQGYNDASQWAECFDLYKDHGIESATWGIGSLCMARSRRLVRSVVQETRRLLGSANLHVFGVALDSLRDVYPLIDSFDTSTWIYWAKMDGAAFVWESTKSRFIQLQARDGERYDTGILLKLNMRALFQMVDDLNLRKNNDMMNTVPEELHPKSQPAYVFPA